MNNDTCKDLMNISLANTCTMLKCSLLLFIVEDGYVVAASVSSLDTTVVSNTTTGEVFIPFTIVMDDDPILPGFLTSGGGDLIAVQLPNTGFLINSNTATFVQITSLTHPGVEIVNDTVRGGVAYVLRDQVYYQYNLDSPVTEPQQFSFQLNYFADGPRINPSISRIPLLRGTLEIVPPGKSTCSLSFHAQNEV